MTNKEIARLRELLSKATPGPWTYKVCPPFEAAAADADLIANAVNALPGLLDDLVCANDRVATLKERLPDPNSAAGAFNDALARTVRIAREERDLAKEAALEVAVRLSRAEEKIARLLRAIVECEHVFVAWRQCGCQLCEIRRETEAGK